MDLYPAATCCQGLDIVGKMAGFGQDCRGARGVMSGSEDFAAHETRVFTLLASAGFAPATIYDIGAANGTWSAVISNNVFPDAAFHMFEPLAKLNESFEQGLRWQEMMKSTPGVCPARRGLLGAECKPVTMCIYPDGFSSTHAGRRCTSGLLHASERSSIHT